MPRTARKQSSTGIYHVMLRGINRQDIFEEPEDYWRMIETLSALQSPWSDSMGTGSRYQGMAPDAHQCACPSQRPSQPAVHSVTPCHIYAYCLMPNHVHLLLREKDWTVGQCVKLIADIYVRYYNKKYGRTGHLFQDRFKSEPCDSSEYFITLIRYIHQNPVKAGLVKEAKDYDYSSWANDYLRQGSVQLCHTDTVIRRYTIEELTAWVEMPLPEQFGCIDISERQVIADTEIRDMIIKKSGLHNIAGFQLLSLEKRKDIIRDVITEIGARPRQLSRVTGMNYETIRKITKTL